MEKNATNLNEYRDEFTPLFWECVSEYTMDRENGYVGFTLPDTIDEGTYQYFITMCDELRAKGFTSKDLVLFDNRW